MHTTPAALADEQAAGPAETRAELLGDALRQAAPVRHVFVQQPPAGPKAARGEQRGSVLGQLVGRRQARALDAYLLLVAVEPALGEDPLPAAAWARALSTSQDPLPEASVTRVWQQLEAHGLIERQRRRRLTHVRPCREDGRGQPYTRPGEGNDGAGQGEWPRQDYYLRLPHEYWTDGYHERLPLTGKALLLIALQATGRKETFHLPYEMAQDWYGVSEETAQRGLRALRDEGLLAQHPQRKQSARAPKGFTTRLHYSLRGPFSTASRAALSSKTRKEVESRTARAGTGGP